MANQPSIPVLEFSWRDFSIYQEVQATPGKLSQAASKTDGKGFVFHDTFYRVSALVNPATIQQFIEQYWSLYDEPAGDCGLLDLLRQGQITVSQNRPASEVAELLATYEIPIALVLNDQGTPVGVFDSHRLMEHLPKAYLIREQSSVMLREMVRLQVRTGDVAAAIRAIESEHSSFHSEGINQNSPDPYYCQACQAFVPGCPCKKHASAVCSPIEIGSFAY
jgi:hypothetical protein